MRSRKKVDYDRIEQGWRAGILSPRQLAANYEEDTGDKVSHAAIIKHFTKHGIPRDLSAKIIARSNDLVTRAMVTEEVTPETKKRDNEIINDAADVISSVRISQRKDIARSRSVAMSLLSELEAQVGVDSAELLSRLGELMESGDMEGMTNAYQKIITLPERVKSMKALAESLRVCIDMERQAFGLDTMPAGSLPGSTIPTVAVQFVNHSPRQDDE